jgi:hypothetical protein
MTETLENVQMDQGLVETPSRNLAGAAERCQVYSVKAIPICVAYYSPGCDVV